MKSVCRFLQEEIQLVEDRIVPCGSNYWIGCKNLDDFFIKTNETLEEVDFDLYFKKREEYIKAYENGETPEFCKDCTFYKPSIPSTNVESYNQENKKFKKIHINHKTCCNARCVYCCLADEGNLDKFEEINKKKTYDIKPILQKIAERGFLDSNVYLYILGGECTLYPDDLKFILDMGMKYNCNFVICSNGIIYNENIAQLLKTGKIELRFSLDSGTKETFEKIKRVEFFERVLQNIEKYSSMAKDNPNAHIQLKYILCPGINDNVEELKGFLRIVEKYNAQQAILSINRFWLDRNKDKAIPKSLRDTITYFVNNQEFSHIQRNIDSGELHDDYLDRILSKKNLFEWIKEIVKK